MQELYDTFLLRKSWTRKLESNYFCPILILELLVLLIAQVRDIQVQACVSLSILAYIIQSFLPGEGQAQLHGYGQQADPGLDGAKKEQADEREREREREREMERVKKEMGGKKRRIGEKVQLVCDCEND